MDALGVPATVAESRRLGRAAVFATLRAARGCSSAVIDSTWFAYARPLVEALSGRVVEVACQVPLDVARERYRARQRHSGHLDARRTETELWGNPYQPLGAGPVVEVDTTGPVDVRTLAAQLRELVR